MKKILSKDFELYHGHKAIFFCEENIVVYANTHLPQMKFKKGLDVFDDRIEDVFLEEDLLFVDLNKIDFHQYAEVDTCIEIYPSKIFLRDVLDKDVKKLLGGIQWLTWCRKSKYCSQCGSKIIHIQDSTEKRCVDCKLSFFPSLSPAVMVLIIKENHVLLARSHHFPDDMYSAVAGFVELGETIECAAHREVEEEVGLNINDLNYFGSQSWPFPSSFMIAFTAEYLSGSINIDPNEIEDAQWFDINSLPRLPSRTSIARQMIDATVQRLKKKD